MSEVVFPGEVIIGVPKNSVIGLPLRSLFLAFVASVCLSAEALAADTVAALQLKQRHFFVGQTLVTMNKLGFRLETKGSFGFVVVAKAPTWNVTVFRDDEKSCYSEPLDVFAETGVFSGFLYSRKEHCLSNGVKPIPIDFYGYRAFRVGERSRYLEYMPLQNVTSEPAEKILYAIYKVPTNYGIPLKFVLRSTARDPLADGITHGTMQTTLQSSGCETVKVSAKIFDAPAGYRKARSVREVVSSQKSREESKDFQEIFH